MKKTLLFLVALMASFTMSMAQTNLTSGKAVVPLGGLKTYNNGTTDFTVSLENLQLLTTDNNTTNVMLFPEAGGGWATDANKTIGIQGFYIDLGEAKSIGAIQSTWEGADCSASIYVSNTVPNENGTLSNETLIASFDNKQEGTKNAAVTVENSGRYIIFVPGDATNWGWGVKMRTFVALEKEASVLTSLEVSPSSVKVGKATTMTFVAKDQLGVPLDGVTYTATNATLEGNVLTATAAGDVVITAELNSVQVQKTIQALDVSDPTTNATEPTDLAANVIAVYSSKYGKGINDSNPGWGVGGGAPNPLYTSLSEPVIADEHKCVHVIGTGFNSRTAGGVGVTTDYTTIHVAVYPFSATKAKIFGDNAYDKALEVDELVPGQWNYIVVEKTENFPNYVLIELVGESEFYLDHFYFAKPAVDDTEAPVLSVAALETPGMGSATLRLQATDNVSKQITYVITDQNSKQYTTKGNSGAEILFTIGGLEYETAYTFSVVAQDDNENKSDAQVVNATTLALTAAPVPTQAAADVISIYSEAYTAATTYNYGVWGQSTQVATETIAEDNMLKLTQFNYLGFELHTQLDLSEMTHVHIDVMPQQAMNLRITPIMNAGTPTELPTSVGKLTAGQWNSCDVKLSDLGLDYENGKCFQLKIDNGNGTDIVFVDNIYFYKGAAPQPAVYPDPATAPTLDANVVDAVYSDVYGKGIKDHNPAWGGGPNPLWTKVEEVSVSETKKYIHVLGTGYGDRPAEALTADYNRAFVALYPTSATAGKLYSDNAYAKAIDFELTAGQWNYIELPVAFATNYVMVELVDETEFYLDHFYFAQVADTEAPVINDATVAAGYGQAVVTAKATDDNAGTIDYVFTLGETVKNAQGASGATVQVVFDGLELGTNYQVSVVAKDAAENASDPTPVNFTTKTIDAIAAAQAPSVDASYVQGLYTDAYDTPAGVAFMNWHAVDVQAEEISASDNNDDKIYRIFTKKGFNYYGVQLDKAYDLSTFESIHLDIWSSAEGTIGFSPVNQAAEPHTAKKTLDLVAGWNYFVIPVTDYTTMDVTTVDQLEFFDAPADMVIGIDNIFFESASIITGIKNVARVQEAAASCYDLQGRRVAKPAKGLYIVNGKKVVFGK